jgi:hypothetical protein
MARPRGTPVFTVEVKRTKRIPAASAEGGRSEERLASTWTSAFDTRPAANIAPQAAAAFRSVERSDEDTVERSTRRILPSLVMPEAESPQASVVAGPRVTRVKRREASGIKKKPAARQAAPRPELRPPAPAPRADATLPPTTAAGSARPIEQAGKGERRQRQRRLMRLSALRRLRRGRPVTLPRGERWKRRLPLLCR